MTSGSRDVSRSCMEQADRAQSSTGHMSAKPPGHRLFEGATLFSKMNSSAFGRFDTAIRGITSHLPQKPFALPKVVVIGGKNAGKSSLLENITKCPIFPRGAGLCTKRPIKLQLQQVRTAKEFSVCVLYDGTCIRLGSTDALLDVVDDIMKPLKSVTDQEITVQICQMDVPTIELVDLPGIQLYPPKLEKETVGLVKKYLADPATLVLCVVDASLPSLDSSPAVKMIREADKLGSTILALTKADLVQDTDLIAANIFDRILRQSAEMQELSDLAGCVAVINRKHNGQLSLLQAETAEKATFATRFQNPAEAYTAPDIQAKLKDNSTSSQLIVKLDALFHSHIQEQWMPAALKSIESAKQKVKAKCAMLGPAPEKLKVCDVLTVLINQAASKTTDAVAKTTIEISGIPTGSGLKSCPLPHLDNVMAAQNVSWSSYHWAASANALHSLVRLVSEAVTASNSAYLEVVQAAFADAFATPHEWKLSRFSSLKDQLTQTTLPSIVGGALAECKPVIDSMVDNAFIQNYHQTLPANTFALLNQRILGCILQHLQAAITHPGSMVQSAPSANQLKLVEDSRTATERSELDSELEQLQAAATGIKGITTGVTSAATSPTAAEQKDVGAKPGQASTRLEPKPVAFALPGAYVFKWPTVTKAYSESELQDDLSDDSPEPCIQTPASKRRKKEEPKCEKKEKRKHKHSAAT